MEDELASRPCGVNFFGEADKIDTTIFENVERLDEIFERASQPIKFPYDHGVARTYKCQ